MTPLQVFEEAVFASTNSTICTKEIILALKTFTESLAVQVEEKRLLEVATDENSLRWKKRINRFLDEDAAIIRQSIT